MAHPNSGQYNHLPIPSYEEATSSRPGSSSSSFLGPQEVSHDAERQGLLARRESDFTPTTSNYCPPAVESARSSADLSLLSADSDSASARNSAEDLRREMGQMELDDSQAAGTSRGLFSKRMASWRGSLSSLNLPFKRYIPDFSSIRWPMGLGLKVPKIDLIILIRAIALIVFMVLFYLVFFTRVFMFKRGGMVHMFDPETVRVFVQSRVNETQIRENLRYVTGFDHVAGTEGSYVLGKWLEAAMQDSGFDDVRMERMDVYLNYPQDGGRGVFILSPEDKKWEAKLEEPQIYKDKKETPVFHGHSKSGTVKGHLIYANYGSREDFKRLKDIGVEVEGSIALVRYYGSQGDRALKIKAAELAGAAGCIIYSDPSQDGFKKGKAYPDGRFRPKDGVQRGGVSLMSWVVGDPLSPGYASTPNERRRASPENNPGLNGIPSLPLSWGDAQTLLQSLKGHGKRAPEDWEGGVPDVEWFTGDKDSPVVQLKNEQETVERQPIYNVIGRIDGWEQPDKRVIIGNHRDAWCYGAADPGSGTAVMAEIIRIFGELKAHGWRPLRTIEFASWDAEEYNLVGSTEHVEGRIEELRREGLAYINVDVATLGPRLRAAGSPLLESAFLRVLNRVVDPQSQRILRDVWKEENEGLDGLGAGSDYVAFQDIAGTSSIDMSFGGDPYPYHSCYDNFQWMEKFGDPEFMYHRAMAQIWSLLILELSDREVVPFDLERYASRFREYVDDVKSYVTAKVTRAVHRSEEKREIQFGALDEAADTFSKNAGIFHRWDNHWDDMIAGTGGFESSAMQSERLNHNDKLTRFETDLLDTDGGLKGRKQFKHIVFAPQAWSGYDEAYFPGIRDAVDDADWPLVQKEVDKIAKITSDASKRLLQD